LTELESSTKKIGVSAHRTTIGFTLHGAGLCGREARKEQLLIEKFAKRNMGDSPNI